MLFASQINAMRKSLLTICSAILLIAICTSSITSKNRVHKLNRVTYHDGNNIGASGGYSQTGCYGSGCHGSKVSTAAKGILSFNGSPLTSSTQIVAGTTYTLSLIIADASEKRFGFDMSSTDGLFASNNTDAVVDANGNAGTEIHHGSSAPFGASPFTFGNFTWTAPKTPELDTFYFATNAANGDNVASSKDHTTLSTVIINVNPSTTPVTLSTFDVSLVSNKVSLSWVTATEINTDHFEIERSLDGKSFSKIGIQKARGTSSSAISYTCGDNVALLNGALYYRLKSVDKSGVFNYSAIKTVMVKSTQNLITSTYPNPSKVGQSVKLTYQSLQAGSVKVDMVNTLGKKIYTTSLPVNEGTNLLSISVAHVSAGIYNIIVADKNANIQKVLLIVE